jgi:hopanoid biosynthesis associated RND transporter like protein HpnN
VSRHCGGLTQELSMPAERNPLIETSPLAAPLLAVTRRTLRMPGVVVGTAVMLAVLAILITVNGLAFKTSRLDLLNPRSEYNQRWLAYLAEFGHRDDAVIVVRADQREVLEAAIDDMAAELAKEPERFESIFFRRDLSKLKTKALHFLPPEQLAGLAKQVEQATALVPRPGMSADPAAALAQLNDRLEHLHSPEPALLAELYRNYAQIAGMTLAALQEQSSADQAGPPRLLASGGAIPAEQFAPQYLLADDGQMGFVLCKLRDDPTQFARGAKEIAALRSALNRVRERHPSAWLGLTGMPVIEFDEMQASQTDTVWTSVLSLVGVLLLFVAGYGGLRHAALACSVLLLGMAYSFGFITLAIGHLNILSSAFAVVLIGLGIDFGIHYVASYLRLRRDGHREIAALLRTAGDVGPGVVTGGVTTAAAFFMAAMTDFLGVRELGVVAGGGILLCVLATVVILPPLILLVDMQWPMAASGARGGATSGGMASTAQILPVGRWLSPVVNRPRLVMAVGLIFVLGLAIGAGNLRYDHNLLNLQPRHLESADIERQLFTKLEDSVWFAVAMCDSREELAAQKTRFEALPTVAKTEEIGSLLPATTPAGEQAVAAIHAALRSLPQQPPPRAAIAAPRLVHEAARAQQLLAAQTPYETPAGQLVGQLRLALTQLPPGVIETQLTAAQDAWITQGLAQLAPLRELAHPQPPQLADLPRELVDRFVGVRHRYLLRVYAQGDIWDMDKLERFVRDVESIDPQITGHPVQTFYASRHMQQSYLWAGVYALGAVLVLLWIDFRSFAHSLLAMVPLAIGALVLCGLLGWLNIPLNPANMIALPLIVGIGVDDGVHLVHEWRRTRGRFRLSDSTAVALLLTSTTTMASFGSLILARHQGLQSLGQVLTLGVMACLGTSLFLFPALLGWLTRGRPEEADEAIELPAVELPAAERATRYQAAELLQVERSITPVAAAESESAPFAEPPWQPQLTTEELPEPAVLFTAVDPGVDTCDAEFEPESPLPTDDQLLAEEPEFAPRELTPHESATRAVRPIERVDEPSPVIPRRRTVTRTNSSEDSADLAISSCGTGRRSPLLDHLSGGPHGEIDERAEHRKLLGVRNSDR